jgi:hypothetical protein
MPELLPNSIPRERKIDTHISSHGNNWIYIFCASCGTDGGRVLENECDFAFYLCNDCAEKFGQIDGTYMVPDEVFWQKLADAQMEKYGRLLAADEIAITLDDHDSLLSRLMKEKR